MTDPPTLTTSIRYGLDPQRPATAIVRSGADLVLLSEELYLRLLRVALAFVIAAAVIDIVVSAITPGQNAAQTALEATPCALAACALWPWPRVRTLYLWERRHPLGSIAPALLGCVFLTADGPYSPLWLLAVAGIALTSITASVGTVMWLCALDSLSFCTGTWLRGDALVSGSDPRHFAALIGLPIAGAMCALAVAALARFVMSLHRIERELASSTPPAPVNATVDAHSPQRTPRLQRLLPRGPSLLTPRQLQVLALVRDGLHQPEIAACLGISERQVERHLSDARTRTNARTVSELVAMLIEGRLFPPQETST